MNRRNGRSLFFLSIIIALAAILRLYRLDVLPPGLYHDEAYNGLEALALLRGELFPQFHEVWEQVAFADAVATMPQHRFPIFFVGNYGREPLFYYLLALSLALVGVEPLAIRLVPAVAGIALVPAVYWLARELDRSALSSYKGHVLSGAEGTYARRHRLALLSALNVATWYWLVHFSRFGIRPMLMALVVTVTFACLLRGFRTERRWAWAVAGLGLGLSAYTYTPARMLPLVILGWLPIVTWIERGLSHRWRQWAIFATVALIVVAPLALFFLRYPEWFMFRTNYVTTDAVGVEASSRGDILIGNLGRVLGGFFLSGEWNLRHNLPGRPMLDPLQFVWLLLGLFVAVSQLLRELVTSLQPPSVRSGAHDKAAGAPSRGRSAEQISSLTHSLCPEPSARAQSNARPRGQTVYLGGYALLCTWLVVMLLPTYLTSDAPHFGRAIGITPAVAVLMAIGMDALWQRASRWRVPGWASALILAVALMCTGFLTIRDYLIRWAGHPDLDRSFQVDYVALAKYARTVPADETIYMTPPTAEYATIQFILAGQDRIKSFTGAAGAVPAGRKDHAATYLIRPGDGASLSLLRGRLPQGEVVASTSSFTAYRIPAVGPRVQPSTPRTATWADQIAMLGVDLPDGPFRPGERVPITVYWRALGDIDLAYTFFIHLLGPPNPATDSSLWGQHDAQPGDGTYATLAWDVGEIVVDEYVVPIPREALPGTYELVAGFYYLPTLERLPVIGGPGQSTNDRVLLKQVYITKSWKE
jgi:4-amino-4-deoxy-L-arabinose transferase-like glycosyltransferase